MKNYIGKKVVKATKMTRQEYNDLRGWDVPEDENGKDLGYLVEYLDGGTKNHSDFSGYISWSPLEVFERAYKISETALDRMLIESSELKERTLKLHEFMQTENFEKLSQLQKTLLHRQYTYMSEYALILDTRIALMSQ